MMGQLGSTPNLLTLLRMIFVPFAVIAVLGGHYGWALTIFIVAGVTDGLDGLLARVMKQTTALGQYLDPVADKLLLSSMFLVLSSVGEIKWKVTILVFSRDTIIMIICTLLYATGAMKTFRPSWLGKANTAAQILTVFFVLMAKVHPNHGLALLRHWGINFTIGLTILSGVHYVLRVAWQMRQTEP
jgi:cardiolipin synthase